MYEKIERVIFFSSILHDKNQRDNLKPRLYDFTYSILADSFWREEIRTADKWEAIPESTWAWRSSASARRWWSTGEILNGLLGPVVARLGVLKAPSSISSEYSATEAMRDSGASFWNIILIIISILLKRIFFAVWTTTRILRIFFALHPASFLCNFFLQSEFLPSI